MRDVVIGLITLAAVLLATRWFRRRIPLPEALALDDEDQLDSPTAPGQAEAFGGTGWPTSDLGAGVPPRAATLLDWAAGHAAEAGRRGRNG